MKEVKKLITLKNGVHFVGNRAETGRNVSWRNRGIHSSWKSVPSFIYNHVFLLLYYINLNYSVQTLWFPFGYLIFKRFSHNLKLINYLEIIYYWTKWRKFHFSVYRDLERHCPVQPGPTGNRSRFFEANNFLFLHRMNWHFAQC